MADRGSRFDWLVFLALGGFWGSSYLFIKFGVETLSPFVLIALRLGIGLSLLVAVVAYAREPLPRSPRIYGHLLVMSIINIVLPFWLITTAEQSVDSSLASILNSTVPLFVILIAAGFLHDEPITVNRLVGLVVGFGGVVLLTGGNIAVGGATFGTLALVGSSIAYAVGSVYARRNVRGLRPMIPALFQVGFAFVISTVLAFLIEDPLSITLTPQAVGSVVWLGLVGSGLAYLAFFRLLGRWGPTRTSLVAYLLPIWGIALGVLFAAEVVDVRVLVGTGLVLTGVALVNSRYGGRRLFGRAAPTTGA
jgi:drug/metabolite transporter (DMT)-like permease